MKRSTATLLAGLAFAALLGAGGALLLSLRDGPPQVAAPAGPDRAAAIAAFLADAPLAEAPPRDDAWALSLPRDHGAHPDARAETWTVTAVLQGPDGRRFDLFFTLLRTALAAPDHDAGADPWALSTLWAGQAVLIGEGAAPSGAEERFARVAGAAGHDGAAREVWLDNWTIGYGAGDAGDGLRLAASTGGVGLDLLLSPEKPALGPDGGDGTAPRGFALPRLAVSGSVTGDAGRLSVTGTAWLERSWGDLPLPGGPIGYDRLILQMSDGTDLSLVRTRRIGWPGAATLDAVMVDPQGGVRYLDDAALDLAVEQGDAAPLTGEAPVAWRLTGPGFDLTATADRGTTRDFLSPVWLGPATVAGTIGGAPVQGGGVLLLTGEDEE